MSNWTLTFDTLDFSGPMTPSGSYWFEVEGANFDLGMAQPITVTLESLLQDGSMVVHTGDDNRRQGFMVTVCGNDTDDLAAGEQALALATRKRTSMIYAPHDGVGAPTFFDVLDSHLEPVYDDLLEVRRNKRRYALVITAAPFGFSVDEQTVISEPVGDATSLDACDATTGWTANNLGDNSSLTVSLDTTTKIQGAGSLKVTAPIISVVFNSGGGIYAQYYVQFSYASAWPVASKRYIAASLRATPGVVPSAPDLVGGVPYPTAIKTDARGDSWVRTTWDIAGTAIQAGTSAPSIKAFFKIPYTGTKTSPTTADFPASINVWLDDITSADTTSSARQSLRRFDVNGSARTPGKLEISHPTSGLGDVLLWMGDDLGDGYRPDLRRYRSPVSSSTVTIDAAMVSGASSNGDEIYDMPASTLAPSAYGVYARVQNQSGSINSSAGISARMLVGSTPVGPTVSTPPTRLTGTGSQQIVFLGVIHLPVLRVPDGSTNGVRITTSLVAGATVLDEVWLMRLDDNAPAVLYAQCGSGTPSASSAVYNHLWVDVPSFDNPRGGSWGGTQPGRTDAMFLPLNIKAVPQMRPPGTTMFLITVGATGSTASFTYRAAWDTYARRL